MNLLLHNMQDIEHVYNLDDSASAVTERQITQEKHGMSQSWTWAAWFSNCYMLLQLKEINYALVIYERLEIPFGMLGLNGTM